MSWRRGASRRSSWRGGGVSRRSSWGGGVSRRSCDGAAACRDRRRDAAGSRFASWRGSYRRCGGSWSAWVVPVVPGSIERDARPRCRTRPRRERCSRGASEAMRRRAFWETGRRPSRRRDEPAALRNERQPGATSGVFMERALHEIVSEGRAVRSSPRKERPPERRSVEQTLHEEPAKRRVDAAARRTLSPSSVRRARPLRGAAARR